MTMNSMMNDLMMCGVALAIAYFLREKIPFLRKLYLPVSVIAGFGLLILGPQVADVISIPESFSQYAGALTNIVFTTLVWGVTINIKKIKSYLDYTLIEFSVTWWQLLLGSIVGYACIATLWPGMPQGWGLCAPFSFLSGHGVSVTQQIAVFDGYGIYGIGDIGLVLATVGLVAAMSLGTIFVNIGIRKGAAKFMTPDRSIEVTSGGALPEERQISIGQEKVENSAINNLLFQFAIVMVVQFAGVTVMNFLGRYTSLFASLASVGGVVGAIILWPVATRLKIDKYVDKKSVNLIGGFSIDVMVTGAIATLSLDIVTTYWLPLVIISVVCIGFTAAYVFFMCYKCCSEEWFEKAVFIYGMSTGVVATGFALHRMVDPDGVSTVPEVQGVASGLQSPITFPLYTVFSIMACTHAGMEIVVSGIMAIGLALIVWMMFRKKIKLQYNR